MNDRSGALGTLIFSLVAVGFLCLTAATCGLAGATQISASGFGEEAVALNILIVGTVWAACLLLPGAWYALRRMQSDSAAEAPRPSRLSGWQPFVLALALYPVILFMGSQVSGRQPLAWWALPLLHIVAATLPVYALSTLALHRLEAGSALRRWGVFGLGLVLGPGLILVIELGLISLVGFGFLIQIASDQSRAMELVLLAERLQFAQSDPEIVLNIVRPYLSNPMLIYGVVAFIVAIVPLVEELLKPIGVWLLAGRQLTPAEGFAAGVLSGAGYALFENLFITLPESGWAIVSVGRIGTTTMHMLTAGITSYALVSAWNHSRFLRLGVLFAGAVLIHSAWNGLTILSVANTLPLADSSLSWVNTLGEVATIALIMLFVSIFAALFFINRRLSTPDLSSHAIIAAPPAPDSGEADTPLSPDRSPAQSERFDPEDQSPNP